ncbi:MAG: Holliday junction branch migration protein RuvA [Methanoculleaceae archaeon]
MIAHLTGEVVATGEDRVVIDVNGIGYHVYVTPATAEKLAGMEAPVRLLTRMVVRDEALYLYGFLRHDERELFGILTGVPGIGPQTAMNILADISFDDFALAIINRDEATLTRVPGIGKKSAQRLIFELEEKMKSYHLAAGTGPSEAADAVAALVSLGFTPREAEEAVDAVLTDERPPTIQDMIRAALARLRER